MAAMMARTTTLMARLDQAANAMLIIAEALTSLNRLMSLQTGQLSCLNGSMLALDQCVMLRGMTDNILQWVLLGRQG